MARSGTVFPAMPNISLALFCRSAPRSGSPQNRPWRILGLHDSAVACAWTVLSWARCSSSARRHDSDAAALRSWPGASPTQNALVCGSTSSPWTRTSTARSPPWSSSAPSASTCQMGKPRAFSKLWTRTRMLKCDTQISSRPCSPLACPCTMTCCALRSTASTRTTLVPSQQTTCGQCLVATLSKASAWNSSWVRQTLTGWARSRARSLWPTCARARFMRSAARLSGTVGGQVCRRWLRLWRVARSAASSRDAAEFVPDTDSPIVG
mmetsp:Transcript_40180/g.93380  ORF Transcript_40180/g.93380 Transcript_40180/m.93380 type:complete len:266 (+) Transcript_40180:323-1120(+)